MSVATATQSTAKPYEATPKLGLGSVLKITFSKGNGRYDLLETQRKLYREHGPVLRQRTGLFKYVNLWGPEANRLVLMNRDGIFSAEIPWKMIMGRIFTNGLLLKDGADHRRHRIIMSEAFKPAVLRNYATMMHAMISAGVEPWGGAPQPLRMFDAYKQLTLDMAATLFMGESLGDEVTEVNTAFEHMVAASMSLVRLPYTFLEFGKGLEGRRKFVAFLRERIAAKREGDGDDMFSRLCHAKSEDGAQFTDTEIIDHMVFLMMAAHDTTTSSLTSMTYLLAKHPDWQDRIREESLAKARDELDMAELDDLTSLTLAMRETLRMYPPLPLIPRVATEDFEYDGYTIPKRTMIEISPILTHYMDDLWTEPDRFDPERFGEERAEHQRHTHQYIPFGAGPHICLGMRFAEIQIRLIMHQLVRRYRWTCPDGYEMPVQQAPISKPRDGLPLRLHRI